MRPDRGRDPIAAALLAAVREEAVDPHLETAGRSWAGLRARAEYHGVTGYVRAAVRDRPELPPSVRAWLALEANRDELETARTQGGLVDVAQGLGTDVPWIVLKGPAMAAVHRDPSLRRSVDLDVLVRPGDVVDVVERLRARGASLLDEDWLQLRVRRATQVGLRLADGALLDLHWRLVNDFEVRDAFRIPTTALFDEVRHTRIGTVTTPTLGATDGLLHLGLHAATAGGNRLIWLKDAERYVAAIPVDWDQVVARAGEWRVRLVLAVMLRRAHVVLGAEVPPGVLRELDPPRVWSALATWGDPRRIAAAQHERSFMRMATRATRPGTGRSAALLAWRAVRAAAHRSPGTAGFVDEHPDGFLHVVSAGAPGASRLAPLDVSVAVSVVVVTHDSAPVIGGLLASLPRELIGGGAVEVVVVDNASRDRTLAVVATDARVRVVRAPRNAGYAAGVNRGLQMARGATVLLANPDSMLAPDALDDLVAHLLADPEAGIAVPRIDGPDGVRLPSLRRTPTLLRAVGEAVLGGSRAGRMARFGELVVDDRSYERSHHVDWASGAVMLIGRECIEATGAWDERFFLYSEETDYQLRAATAGFRVRYVPTARAVHLGGDQQHSPGLWSLAATNRVRAYGMRHGPASTRAFQTVLAAGEAVRALAGRDTSRVATAALWRWREEAA